MRVGLDDELSTCSTSTVATKDEEKCEGEVRKRREAEVR